MSESCVVIELGHGEIEVADGESAVARHCC